MNRRITGVVAVAALAAGLAGGIGACGGGSSGPPSATSVLQSDGYTPNSSLTGDLQSGLGSDAASNVSSLQAGTQGSPPTSVQLVIVFTDSGSASTATSALNSQFGGDGITTSQNGDVVTATGSTSAFDAAGNS